jgi:hypothetical protein
MATSISEIEKFLNLIERNTSFIQMNFNSMKTWFDSNALNMNLRFPREKNHLSSDNYIIRKLTIVFPPRLVSVIGNPFLRKCVSTDLCLKVISGMSIEFIVCQ